jgi:hypothetical protein
VDTFYSYVEGKGMMIRLDKNGKIYGFAIENASYFIKDKPDFAYVMYPIIHPLRAKIIFGLTFGVSKLMYNVSKIGSAAVLTGYITQPA